MESNAMEEQQTQIIPVELANGTVIHVQATLLGGEEQVSVHLPSFDEVGHAVEGIAHTLVTSLERVKPRKTSVELGVAIALESGKLTALLVQGSSTANLKITLEWGGE
jgi:hypothetical protein